MAAVGTAPLPRDQRLQPFPEIFAAEEPAKDASNGQIVEYGSAPWRPEQLPAVARSLAANERALNRIVEASRLPRHHV